MNLDLDPDPGQYNHQIDFKTSLKSKKKTFNFQVWTYTLEISSHQEDVGDDVRLQPVPQVAFQQIFVGLNSAFPFVLYIWIRIRNPDPRTQMNLNPTGSGSASLL